MTPSWVTKPGTALSATAHGDDGDFSRRRKSGGAQPGKGKRQRSEQWNQTPPDVNERRPDGRFVRSDNSIDLCPDYNAGTCNTQCKRWPRLMHLCEWCRGQHPTWEHDSIMKAKAGKKEKGKGAKGGGGKGKEKKEKKGPKGYGKWGNNNGWGTGSWNSGYVS